ncbi:glycosyltransferase [Lacinutrix iliipiscaria]|uniref:Glycosyltransferase n=1 Tax=Lacinutrix iliipiscaria TaxID=1230532 RepID=A0ABW5WP14_9FLAO
MMVLLLVCITIIYLFLIGSLALGFDKVKSFYVYDVQATTSFSVIIPFRNEAENLPELLKSLSVIHYPKHLIEVFLVDDASDDESIDIVTQFISKSKISVHLIKNDRQSLSPKKDAITSAIHLASNEWIVTTDADCILPKYWLASFDAFIQKNNTDLIVAPVTYSKVDSFLKRFQLLDFLSLQGATIGGFGIHRPFLCNGANLAYKTKLFKSVNGFIGNDHIASGDDIFLLEKALKQKSSTVHYLKSEKAIVTTKAEPDVKQLISQRVRWASKTSKYKSLFAKITGLIILMMNASLIVGLTLSSIGIFPIKILLYLFFIKLSIDFLLLFKTARFFNQESYLSSYLFCGLLYPIFCVYIAFISLFSHYKWKGRAFRK